VSRSWRGSGALRGGPSTARVPAPWGEATDLLDQRLGRLRPKRHAKCGHRWAQRPPEFGDVPDRLLVDSFWLAQGIARLARGGRVLLLGCSSLFQLGLVFLELLRQAPKGTLLLDNPQDGGVSLLLDRH
jgi:hypothetical protein